MREPPVESHHPVVRVLLILRSKQNAVPLANRVEEKFPAFQIYREKVHRRENIPEKARK